MSEWQPIETDPKYGAIVWLSDGFSMRLGWWAEGEKYQHHESVGGGWRDFYINRDLPFAPTHWMPIPEPPK